MYLVYRPDGQEEQRWLYEPGKLRTFDTEAIERVTGFNYGLEFKQKLQQGNITARRALLWVYLRKTHPTTKYQDVDFADAELQLEYDREELTAMRAEVEASGELTPLQKAMQLAAIDRQLPTAPEAPGKAPASANESSTPSPSAASTQQ